MNSLFVDNMIITPHLLLGAAIGAKIKKIGWIIVLGILSHLILDKIPHWDYGRKLEEIPRDKYFKKELFIEFLKIGLDGIIGLLIIFVILWQKNIIKVNYLIFIFIGILASLSLDLALGITKFFYHKSKFSKNYVDFHHKFLHHQKHIRKPTLLGLATEILISIIAILILLI